MYTIVHSEFRRSKTQNRARARERKKARLKCLCLRCYHTHAVLYTLPPLPRYIDVDEALIGTEFTLEIANALATPSFELGVTTAEEWAALATTAPAPYGEIEMPELIFTVNASYFRQLSFAEMTKVASFWTESSCEIMSLFRSAVRDCTLHPFVSNCTAGLQHRRAATPGFHPLLLLIRVLSVGMLECWNVGPFCRSASTGWHEQVQDENRF